MLSFSNNFHALDRLFENSWIMDSRITDHMINIYKYFHNYVSCPSSRKIIMADGSLNTIVRMGKIKLSSTLILENGLHVSKLCIHLMSPNYHKIYTANFHCFIFIEIFRIRT